MATTPTQRTLALCRKHGWTSQVVEKWNAHAKVRQDLFGVIDVVCMDGQSIIGVQSTSGDNVSNRVQKMRDEPRAKEWLRSGGRLFVHGWRKIKNRWKPREIEITDAILDGGDYEG